MRSISKTTGFIAVTIGKATVKATGNVGVKKIKKLVNAVDKVCPEGDVLTLGIGSNGIRASFGKRVSTKHIVFLLGSCVAVWYGGKLIYKHLEKKIAGTPQKNNEEPQSPVKQPVNQSAAEIRDKAKEELNGDYDAGQLIGKFLYKGDRTVVYSPYGVGKSVFCIQMAIDISQGKVSMIAPDDNGTHTPQTVVYYDGEMDDTDIWKITGSMDLSKLTNLKFRRGGFFKHIDQWLADVQVVIKTTSGDITIFLDNITSVCSTINAESIRELFLLHLKSIQEEEKKQGRTVTFVVVAHTNKQLVLAGSSNLGNFASAILGLYKKDSKHIILKVDKPRKYGDMEGKQFLLEKKQTSEGYKYDENVGEYKGVTDEPEPSDETTPHYPTKPVWDGKLSLEKTIEMKEFYQHGVNGHGCVPTAEKFGLTDHKSMKKELERLEEYLAAFEEKDE